MEAHLNVSNGILTVMSIDSSMYRSMLLASVFLSDGRPDAQGVPGAAVPGTIQAVQWVFGHIDY
jgi:hypothetical protein